MIKLENFDLLNFSGLSYGGHGGSKKGVILNGEKWFLKYPKSTKSMDVKGISYSTTPLSEYIGSHIYESIGLETHKTMLGSANGKIVVACKDFLDSSEVIIDYNMIKNEYDEELEDVLSSSGNVFGCDLKEVILIMKENVYFKSFPELKNRFWDMFVIDAFIGNNDRNEGNWGLVLNKENKNLKIAPVYDNGASFFNKSSDDKLSSIIDDDFKFKQSVYESSISFYRTNEKSINPLKYIESMNDEECNNAIMRIVPKINMNKIKEIFDEIPYKYDDLVVMSDIQRNYYLKTLKYRYEKVLLPIYNKLTENFD